VELLEEPGATPEAEMPHTSAPGRTVALGADHGGYALKEDLKAYLGELGYEVVDCGTHSTASVDYPDLAYAVARLVSDGRAWRGIIVDGAGIGSCMAANKVPNVRAAMCYDYATAVNSREHNDANVLTLGGMLIGRNLARQIVKVWLETGFGGDRHARRVDKIMRIEQRFLRK
jgi:ribose 5-phosphate isomerase B